MNLPVTSFGRAVLIALLFAAGVPAASWSIFSRFVAEPDPDAAASAPPEPTPPMNPQRPRTVVASVEGTVERFDNQGDWKRVERGDQIAEHEALRTGAHGRVDLLVGDAVSQLTVPGQSEIRVDEIGAVHHQVTLVRGRVLVDYKPGTGRVLRIDGKNGVAETSGARFTMLSTGSAVAVATESGAVNLSARGAKVEVRAGQQSVVVAGEAPRKVEPIPVHALLKVSRLASEKGLCAAIEGRVRPGTEVVVDETPVVVADDGHFRARVARREGLSEVKVVAREPGGALRQELIACRSSAPEEPAHLTVDWQ